MDHLNIINGSGLVSTPRSCWSSGWIFVSFLTSRLLKWIKGYLRVGFTVPWTEDSNLAYFSVFHKRIAAKISIWLKKNISSILSNGGIILKIFFHCRINQQHFKKCSDHRETDWRHMWRLRWERAVCQNSTCSTHAAPERERSQTLCVCVC